MLIIYLLLSLFSLWVIGSLWATWKTIKWNHEKINIPKVAQHIPLKNFEVTTSDKKNIKGWWAENNSKKMVILIAGIYSNRLKMISRAIYFWEKGYSITLFDLRGTGESSSTFTSFGWHEQQDLLAVYQFLLNKGYTDFGFSGISLGSATIAYTYPNIPQPLFMILDSCYDNINNALLARLKKYLNTDIAFLAIWVRLFTILLLKVNSEKLFPEYHFQQFNCPTLIVTGDSEKVLPLPLTQKLYKMCVSKKKHLHIIKGADHEDFTQRFYSEYFETVNAFLKQHSLDDI